MNNEILNEILDEIRNLSKLDIKYIPVRRVCFNRSDDIVVTIYDGKEFGMKIYREDYLFNLYKQIVYHILYKKGMLEKEISMGLKNKFYVYGIQAFVDYIIELFNNKKQGNIQNF